MDLETITEIDRWPEDDYELVLTQIGEDRVAEFRLMQHREGCHDRDVTQDVEAYARRIKQLVGK